MKVRCKNKPNITGTSSKFNLGSNKEVIVIYEDGYIDSVFISELEVFITKNLKFLLNKGEKQEWSPVGHWISMDEAFKNKDLITDNYNTKFFEPKDEEEKNRGYRL